MNQEDKMSTGEIVKMIMNAGEYYGEDLDRFEEFLNHIFRKYLSK